MYTRTEFERQRDRSAAAAKVIVPLTLELTQARSVVDIGCGTGTWLRTFAENGIQDYLGVDGHYVEPDLLQIPRERFLTADLREPISTGRTFDLACSLEVAEHLPADGAAAFVEQLTHLAPAVLFSAAIPGQTGPGHINEQWQDYWASLFERFGHSPVDAIRPAVWGDKDVVFWYQQNVLLYLRNDRLPVGWVRPQLMNIAHPELVAQYAHQVSEPAFISGRDALAALGRSLRHRLLMK
jgi:SAM-dependent methyltransferase